ncbi:MAG: glycosyltransferase [Roseiflexaceae bacterium]|nr:glycosyltransferase [Roseiflexaceae bacterium]
MILLYALTAFTLVIVGLFALGITIFLRRIPVLQPADGVEGVAPLISVVVPARNEAVHIERCVRSLLSQNYPNLEVIAVDDASTDATPEILARLAAECSRLTVVDGRPLQKGWTGKNNAVFSGVQRARGEWMLFVDADVTINEGAVGAAYAVATQRGVKMVTLWARQELETFWERVVQPVIIGLNMSTDTLLRVNNMRYPSWAFANGQFIFVERAAYEQVGGHGKVRSEVVEDQRLSWEFKHAGLPILMMDGTRMLSTRMYSSLESIWEGWSKNNFLMMQRKFSRVALSLLAIYTLSISPFLLSICALVAFKYTNSLIDPLFVNLFSAALLLWTRWRARSFFPTPRRDYLLHPLGGFVFMAIVINSAYRHSQRRGVTWKGRTYGDADAVG